MRVLSLFLIVVLAAGTASAKSRDPIRLAEGVTPAQQVVTAIVARALKKSGFRPEIVAVPQADVLPALAEGALHAHPSVLAAAQPALGGVLDDKSVRSLGGLARNKPDDPALKLVWPGMKKKWPYAQKMLKRMVIKPAVLEGLAAEVTSGATPAAVAETWWKANRKAWKPWVAASTNWMKP